MATRKIAIIIERANIALGGAERSVFEHAAALRSLGFEVDVLAAKGQTKNKNIHILCSETAGERTAYDAFANAIKEHIAVHRYDIVHSVLPFEFADIYQPRGGTYPESILRNAASYRNKLLETYKRLTAFANSRRNVLLRAEKRVCRSCDGPKLVAISNYVAEQFKRHYGVTDDRLVVIPNGVRVHRKIDMGRADVLRAQILGRLDLTEADSPLFFLFVANNFRLKGLSPLIEALSAAPRAYLIVAGAAKSHKYRLLARKCGVHDRIVFLGPVRHVRYALCISDVAVLPTFYDPSSRYILEALAAEKPVITTRFNGATDLFTDREHGYVIDSPNDTPALAAAINYYSNRNNIKKSSQSISNDSIRERVSVARVAERLAELYEEILKKKGVK